MTSTTEQLAPEVDIRRADDRAKTNIGWLDSKHSFSFGQHYDPANTHHGLLLVNNDDIVDPGTGFETHPHRDMEIVTWVLQGSLVHQDSTGHSGVIYPGLAQRMSAGTGILHSEKNDSWRLQGDEHRDPVHFVQMWVVPDEGGITPGYEQLEIADELLSGGAGPGRLRHGQARRRGRDPDQQQVRGACTPPGSRPASRCQLPEAPFLHLFVPRGSVDARGRRRAGDRRRRAVHRDRRPAGHRDRAGRDPGLGDARSAGLARLQAVPGPVRHRQSAGHRRICRVVLVHLGDRPLHVLAEDPAQLRVLRQARVVSRLHPARDEPRPEVVCHAVAGVHRPA